MLRIHAFILVSADRCCTVYGGSECSVLYAGCCVYCLLRLLVLLMPLTGCWTGQVVQKLFHLGEEALCNCHYITCHLFNTCNQSSL